MRLKLLPLLVAGVVLSATTARATPSRVLGLGDLGRYVEDDSNVLMYPGLIQKYAHFMYIDIGGPTGLQNSLNESAAGNLSGAAYVKLGDDLQIGVASSDFAPGFQNTFLGKVAEKAAMGNGAAFTGLQLDAIRRYDFLFGYSLSKDSGLGLRLSYGSSTNSFSPDQDDKDTDGNPRKADSQAQREFTASLGFSSQMSRDFGIDSAIDFTSYGLSYKKNDVDAFTGGGGIGVGVNVRARLALTKWWTLIPQASYRGASFSLDETKTIPAFGQDNTDVPKTFDPGLKQTHSGKFNTLDIGVVSALKASKVASFWIGGGFQLTRESFGWTSKADGVDLSQDQSKTQYSLPYVKFAFEMQPIDNVRFRAGVEKYAYSSSVYTYDVNMHPNTEAGERKFIEHTSSSTGALDPAQKDFAAYLGVSLFTQNGLTFDFLLDNELLRNGLSTLFTQKMALRGAVSYKF